MAPLKAHFTGLGSSSSCLVFTIVIGSLLSSVSQASYVVDYTDGLGRRFDGIGGLSGGGATSKLLINYPEPERSHILDYLFKPNFGASLHILKVEIGGDSQSTDGTESSHMHESWDESYQRGYEWWLMTEAKKRNPGIKLYGLPWAFPGWVGNGTLDPYRYPQLTASYITKWIQGAKKYYNLTIDYIGIWNERSYSSTYIKVLRSSLNAQGLQSVKIVATDGDWSISNDLLKDHDLAKAVDIIGAHYPGTNTTDASIKTNKTLWSSEDYSTFNDNVGAGCWARILNQNYVNGYMTSTISWNLIASYYQALPYGRDGLMTGMEPWSGHYVVESPIWVTAHTAQFTKIGWKYLKHGRGVGKLDRGGSYVSMLSPDTKHFTMVIETMSRNHSKCIRPSLPPYTVQPQTAIFKLKGKLADIQQLNVWYTELIFNGGLSILMKKESPLKVVGGTFKLSLKVDVLYTLTTLNVGQKGQYPTPPPSKPFPLPFKDDYESYPEYSEAFNFGAQTGVFEVRQTEDVKHSKVNRQVVLNQPVDWVVSKRPVNLGGDFNWSDVFVQVDVMLPSVNCTNGTFVAARISAGGGSVPSAAGVFFFLYPKTHMAVATLDLAQTKVLAKHSLPQFGYDKWHQVALGVKGNQFTCYLDKKIIFSNLNIPQSISHGFVGYGTDYFGLADFDNFIVNSK